LDLPVPAVASNRLFRCGGEEFAIIVRAGDRERAHQEKEKKKSAPFDAGKK